MISIKNILLFLSLFVTIKTLNENIPEDKDDAVAIKKVVWDEYERDTGAYYIIYSQYTSIYSKVTSYIHLPTSLNTNNGKRNAYISFGVLGLHGFIDTGIINPGSGWSPCYNLNGSMKVEKGYSDIKGVEKVGIELEVTSSKVVKFSLSFRDSDLNILKSYSTEIDASSYFDKNGVNFRFYRFASLVNDKNNGVPDNQNDNTYMINGMFSKLCIVVNKKVKSWGIDNDYVELGWLVSSKKIEFSHAEDHESFSIKHYPSKNYGSTSLNTLYFNLSFLHLVIILIFLI